VRLQTDEVYGTKGSSGMEGSSGRSVISRGLDVADALDRTLAIVNFSREHSVTWTGVIILIRLKF